MAKSDTKSAKSAKKVEAPKKGKSVAEAPVANGKVSLDASYPILTFL
jgi:hypothetical protein